MNTLHQRVDDLWSDLESTSNLTAADDRTLRSLDANACDGTLTEARLERMRYTLTANRKRTYGFDHASGRATAPRKSLPQAEEEPLFGDYELIIDRCLDGDAAVKRAVQYADNNGRRGLASLRYHLRKTRASVPADMQRILASCEADQAYYDDPTRQAAAAKPDMRNIERRGGGYRVSVMVEGKRHRETFETLEDARDYRDRITRQKVLG